MRLIDADALKKKLYKPFNWNNSPEEMQEQSDFNYFDVMIDATPTIDAVLVVHGRWEKDREGNTICTCCHRNIPTVACTQVYEDDEYSWDEEIFETNYCPNCGAKMDIPSP